MTKAVRVHKVGGPEALVYEDVEVPAPGPGEVASGSMPSA
jgi:NADPH2:quinone reductase